MEGGGGRRMTLKTQIEELQARHAALTAERENLNPWKDSMREEALGKALKTIDAEIRSLIEQDVAVHAGLSDDLKAPRKDFVTVERRLAKLEKAQAQAPAAKPKPTKLPDWVHEKIDESPSSILATQHKEHGAAHLLHYVRGYDLLIVLDQLVSTFKDERKAVQDAFQRVDALEKRASELETKSHNLRYHGVWREGHVAQPGNFYTHAGALWHANEPTMDKPGTSKAWTLAVKAGRDGKDAR
jgi:hypothetical protein